MKKISKPKKIFCEIVSDMNKAHRFVSRTSWAIMYDEEIFMLAEKTRERKRRAEILRRLESQELIVITKLASRVMIELTGKGRHQALIELILRKKRTLPVSKVCVVAFDIPERVRRVRVALNSLLMRAGFDRVQLSVWSGVIDIADELKTLIKLLKVEKWVRVYIADQ